MRGRPLLHCRRVPMRAPMPGPQLRARRVRGRVRSLPRGVVLRRGALRLRGELHEAGLRQGRRLPRRRLLPSHKGSMHGPGGRKGRVRRRRTLRGRDLLCAGALLRRLSRRPVRAARPAKARAACATAAKRTWSATSSSGRASRPRSKPARPAEEKGTAAWTSTSSASQVRAASSGKPVTSAKKICTVGGAWSATRVPHGWPARHRAPLGTPAHATLTVPPTTTAAPLGDACTTRSKARAAPTRHPASRAWSATRPWTRPCASRRAGPASRALSRPTVRRLCAATPPTTRRSAGRPETPALHAPSTRTALRASAATPATPRPGASYHRASLAHPARRTTIAPTRCTARIPGRAAASAARATPVSRTSTVSAPLSAILHSARRSADRGAD